ncbi:Ribosomal_protein L5 [Hexamita inflata]|uniref:Ribosomal protein L5 n=1 Tax=Hexamita inflata TaxID=28002 RepID=A0AA86QIL8_9EUKA|nr:Ribosomal protein L5 [Hexamita inflata]CAI9955248.1 Ribosomal protein L5 [Hexamita inflata]CAI9955250.1 Ribosomal protein L5 [Hexamita inflata]CAI9956149.1 Ribosomal protein L5 [Hexamita inflata]CAI9956180.1 Ribosomal protein L5 [Hexamita inflata]
MAVKENPMRQIKVEKLVVQCCIGGEGDQLTKVSKVLQQLTEQPPSYGKSRLTVRGFGIRRGQQIAAKVTVRGEKALNIIEKALRVKSYTLPENCFSNEGNFGFGITEHIDLGIKYDPSIGIFGMDFTIVLARPGKRVGTRKHNQTAIGCTHKISKQEAIDFATQKFEVSVTKK